MNRKQIREYGRLMVDEAGEEPLGLEKDIELNILINVGYQNIYLLLLDICPWYFRKTFLITTKNATRVYNIATDCNVTDFFLMEDIYWNTSGYRADPLYHIRPDQEREFTTVGETGDPQGWGYESQGNIFLAPYPPTAVANQFKAYYFPVLPDLNHDETDQETLAPYTYATPKLPTVAHPLIALDMARQWCAISGQSVAMIEDRAKELLQSIRRQLSTRQGMTPPITPNWNEYKRTTI